ncbi:MAG: hypothetical protein FJX11_02975 [Alphaproteobacteria bacterium]|nr:hypothetical protein [Alphaproteobacteria bacterium]
MFDYYRFDNLDTEESLIIDRWSYVWAALGGPVYVAAKGFFVAAALMSAISLCLGGAAFAVLVAVIGLVDSLILSLLAAAAIPLTALAVQGEIAVQLVRRALVRRGWREGY